MATYTELFQTFGQDPEHAAARRELLLAHAQATLWASTVGDRLDNSAFTVFTLMRQALDAARHLRRADREDQKEQERLGLQLTQALEAQEQALLFWCDSHGLRPDDAPFSAPKHSKNQKTVPQEEHFQADASAGESFTMLLE